jgi:hypothetical protein
MTRPQTGVGTSCGQVLLSMVYHTRTNACLDNRWDWDPWRGPGAAIDVLQRRVVGAPGLWHRFSGGPVINVINPDSIYNFSCGRCQTRR